MPIARPHRFVVLTAFAASLCNCADVPRTNRFDTEAPLNHQAQAHVLFNVTIQPSDPNAGAGAPLAQAQIKLTGPATLTGVTDDSGSADMSALLPGTYSVLVGAAGYYFNTTNMTVLPGQTIAMDVSLRATPDVGHLAAMGQIVGVAVKADQLDTDSGAQNNSGITVTTTTDPNAVSVTDNEGRFNLSVLPGPYTIVFSAPGYNRVLLTNVNVSADAVVAPCNGALVLEKQSVAD